MSFKKSQKYLSETLIEKKPETYSSSMEPFVDYTEIKSWMIINPISKLLFLTKYQ